MTDILPSVSRRTTLAWFAAAATWSQLPYNALAATPRGARTKAHKPVPNGYGTDPSQTDPKVPWARTMSKEQLQQFARLADMILPATAIAPAPSAVGVADFADEWISAPYETQIADREIILTGLKWLDGEAERQAGNGWLNITDAARRAILDGIAAEPPPPERARENLFFRRSRFLIVGAYYSTEAGFKAIGYVGNVALEAFPPPPPDVLALLESRLRALNL